MSKDKCHKECDQSMVIGNNIDVRVNSCDCEIKADIVVKECQSVRLWGQVKNCSGEPVAYALLKLLKVIHRAGNCDYQGVAHTVSDCKGFYQFDLSTDEIGCSYKILVSRAVTGNERTLRQKGNCNPCVCQKTIHDSDNSSDEVDESGPEN